jgi:transposase
LAPLSLAGIKKGARQSKLALVFLDESGFMLQPVRRRTWRPSGDTPVHKAWDRHDRISAIGAVRVTANLRRLGFYFQLLRQNVTADDLVEFLTAMHAHFGRKVILIWDRWNVHRAAAKYFEQHYPQWFQFEELPSYCPELNPVEPCWKHTKYDELPNYVPDDLDQLDGAVSASLTALRADQDTLRGAFEYCQLKLSA